MLLPFNVDRPERRTPVCTYTLMALNVVVYLATILHANILLPGERAAWREQSGQSESLSLQFPARHRAAQTLDFSMPMTRRGQSESLPAPDPNAPQTAPYQSAPDGTSPDGSATGVATDGSAPDGESAYSSAANKERDTMSRLQEIAAKMKIGTATQDEVIEAETIQWRAEHADDWFTLDPHPSIFKWLAYWVGAPSFIGFFTSMFLHGGFDHILGNMLFLWIFGRALEEALGPVVFSAAYMVCGIASTLLFHIATVAFSPSSEMIPFMGASGAIMGLLGLFAPRFYRTPVRIFYTTWMGFRVLYIGAAVLGFMLTRVMGTPGATLAFLIVLGGMVLYGEEDFWNEFRWPAMYAITLYIAWNDLLPVAIELYTGGSLDGTAHWAHIGGFLCGVIYAFLVGLTGEGKTEYLATDAQAALEKKHGSTALEHAQALLKHKPGDAAALRLMAQAYDTKRDKENALANWRASFDASLKAGDRDTACATYLQTLAKHPDYLPPANTLLTIGATLMRSGQHLDAAQTLTKVYVSYPEAPESEVALLRNAQLYLQQMNDPATAQRLLQALLQRYPNTQWKTQAENGLKVAQAQLNLEAPAAPSVPRKL